MFTQQLVVELLYKQGLQTTINHIQLTYISIGRKVSSVNYGILAGFELVLEVRCNFDIFEFDAKLLILAVWLVGIAEFYVFLCRKGDSSYPKSIADHTQARSLWAWGFSAIDDEM